MQTTPHWPILYVASINKLTGLTI